MINDESASGRATMRSAWCSRLPSPERTKKMDQGCCVPAVEADHAALRARQTELEHFLLAAPATGWGDAVAKARYLLTLFAQTPAAEDPRRVRLIADVLADFERLPCSTEAPARRG
jgi:hypothetical protein